MKLQITLTQGQYDHLYNIMCSQDEIIDYLNESDDFDPQTFDNLFDAVCAAKGGQIMAYCDRCGNFDESHRESMDYPKDSQHCIQDYQPDLYYYWDSPIEEDLRLA